MREILFRGKGKCETVEHHKGDWLFGDYASLKDSKTTMHFIYGQGEIDITTLGQYTGLKDKNGTKIFEGDIVKRQWGDYPFQYQLYFVKFSFGKFELEAINTKGTRYIPYHYECEVIGNIYDNPELVKGE